MKRLIRHLIPYSLLSFMVLFAIRLIVIFPPLIMQRVIDIHIPNGDIAKVIQSVLLFVGIPVAAGAAQAVYQYVSAMFCRREAFLINQQVVQNILKKPMPYHHQNNSAELAAQVTKDASGFIRLWITDIPEAVSVIGAAIVTFAAIARLNASLGAIQLVYIPLILIPGKIIGKRVNKNARIIFANIAKSRAFIHEVFRGVRTVKLNGMLNFVLKKYRSLFMRNSKLFAQTAMAETVVGSIMTSSLSAVMLGAGFVLGATLIIQGDLTVGSLISYISLVPALHQGIAGIAGTNINFMKQLGEFEVLFSLYAEEPAQTHAAKMDEFASCIQVEAVAFSYASASPSAVLLDVSLEIPKGAWIAIEGRSGIGKSTLINLILGLEAPGEGKILMDGVDVQQIDREWYWNRFAVVDQAPFLLYGTLRENFLAVNNAITEDEMRRALDKVELGEFIRSHPQGLDIYVGEDGTTVSGGQKQRIALARALACHKPILVLDEATSQIDPNTEQRLCEMLQMEKENGLTILSVSHRKQFHQFADKVFLLTQDGLKA